jgi:hypothetical protein
MFRHFARTYMAVRECFAPVGHRRLEAQTEVLADLHSCLESLHTRVLEMEQRITKCKQQAVHHMLLSRREGTAMGRAREQQRAQLCMQDRRRVQGDHDKAMRMMHMLQTQIDSIVATNMDNIIVDTMRNYNLNAARLSMPARADQILHLGDELADRQSEIAALQEAISGVTTHYVPSHAGTLAEASNNDEEGLLRELEALMSADEEQPVVHQPYRFPSLPSTTSTTTTTTPSTPSTPTPTPTPTPTTTTTTTTPVVVEEEQPVPAPTS